MSARKLGPSAAADVTDAAESACSLPQHGKLVSFDSAALLGWIAGDDGALYSFSAADVVGDTNIAIGRSVVFSGTGEIAHEVRVTQDPAPLRVNRASFPEELSGQVAGEDGVRYDVAAVDGLGENKIVVGQAVSFANSGDVAHQVRAVPAETSEPKKSRFIGVSLIAAALIGGVLFHYFQRDSESAEPAAVEPLLSEAPAEVAADAAPSPDDAIVVAESEAAEIASAAEAQAEPTAPPIASIPAATKAAEVVEISPEPASQPPAPPPVARAPRPGPRAGKATPSPAVVRAAPTPAAPTTVAWWPAPRPGRLNMVYAGYLAGSSSVVLLFDSDFSSAESADRHVAVTGSDGARLAARWAVSPDNSRMLLLKAPPGLYKLTVAPELADAAGKSLGLRLSGSVRVR